MLGCAVLQHGRALPSARETARQAAEFAVMCKAKKLLLGHYSSRYKTEDRLLEEAVKVFPNTVLANEGLRIEL